MNKLRIDGNPISKLSHTFLYAIYSITTLHYIDGKEVTIKQRRLAIEQFAKDEASKLVNDLKIEMQKAKELGRNKDAALKERDDAIRRLHKNSNNENSDPTLSKYATVELDELNQLLTQHSNGIIIIIIIIIIILLYYYIIIIRLCVSQKINFTFTTKTSRN